MVTGAGLPLPQPWLLAVWATRPDSEAWAGAPMLPVPGHPLERPQTQPTQAEATGPPGSLMLGGGWGRDLCASSPNILLVSARSLALARLLPVSGPQFPQL